MYEPNVEIGEPETVSRITKALGVVAIVNFVAFLAIGAYLGGYARGHVAGAPYFLMWYGHPTEVPAGIYRYSRWHEYAMLSTHAIAFISWTVTRRGRRKRKDTVQS